VKIWEKILIYSTLLFIVLFNGAGIIIETIYNRNLNLVITTGLNEYGAVK